MEDILVMYFLDMELLEICYFGLIWVFVIMFGGVISFFFLWM